MEGALAHNGQGTLDGKDVVVHGLGELGAPLLRQLLERRVARIVVADSSKDALDAAASALDGAGAVDLRLVAEGDVSILGEPCHVLVANGTPWAVPSWVGVVRLVPDVPRSAAQPDRMAVTQPRPRSRPPPSRPSRHPSCVRPCRTRWKSPSATANSCTLQASSTCRTWLCIGTPVTRALDHTRGGRDLHLLQHAALPSPRARRQHACGGQ